MNSITLTESLYLSITFKAGFLANSVAFYAAQIRVFLRIAEGPELSTHYRG